MQIEKVPQCLLGNGVCPEKCILYKDAVKITSELGDKFDPAASRLAVVFGDAFNPDINVTHVASVIASCAREPRPPKEQGKKIRGRS